MRYQVTQVAGGVLLLSGLIGLIAAVAAELSLGTDVEAVIISEIANHHMLLVTAAGFLALIGAILLMGCLVLKALGQQTQAIRDAVEAPDSCPAASLISKLGRGSEPVVLATRSSVYRSGDKA